MVTSSKRTRERSTKRRMRTIRIVERDMDMAVTAYLVPQIDRRQLTDLHFPTLSHRPGVWESSTAITRLALLSDDGVLHRRRIPYQHTAGGAAYCYTVGYAAVELVADRLDLPPDLVKRRQEGDARLSFVTYPHRRLLADTYVALVRATAAQALHLDWHSEYELKLLKERVTVAGKQVPVEPDAFFYLGNLTRGGGAAFACEIQVASDPSKWLKKCLAYVRYYDSGAYQKRWGYKSLRILGITTSETRARNLRNAIESCGDITSSGVRDWFWTSWRDAVVSDVWGPIWFVGNGSEGRRLLGC